ncbi:unnamed protein product [Microthlaspi erraticum]|uniref:Disease resistance R13L4/SHOC-2-like LRR domain-containing protein n=1 Tax=Microthlaspi erraticum TaxID=1685480 RepID=A0A6D2JAW4_9BRAS|nr:unnamed protein product [Microthlaspi erraticum]
MHDVVREMAMWISSDLGCVIQAGVGLREVPHVEDWSSVKKMSLMRNNIENISSSISNKCGKLTTLFLQGNEPLLHISDEFFLSTPMLVVLDISWNGQLVELPEEICELVSLRYLDISCTNLKQLPAGFIKLRNLIHLDLEGTRNLESITGISNLSSLRVLKLKASGVWLDVSLLEELQCLEHLQVSTGCIKSSLAAEKMLYAPRVVNAIQEIHFKDMKEESFRILTLPTMVNLRKLVLYRCEMLEINMERTTSCNTNQTSPCFPNLTYVYIRQCDGLKDLTWLLFAPNLTTLEVWYSHQIEDIISKEKALSMVANEADITIPFQKLERLYLMALRGLKSIYWNPLPFLCLKEVDVTRCRNLKKPPVSSIPGTAGIDFALE